MQQTLIVTTTLILTGLAVAFAFRCGLFNIGGQGQYIVGAIFAVWIGSSFEGLNPFVHVLLAAIAGAVVRRPLGGHRRLPEGDGRRARGDLDDHAQLDRDLGRRRSSSASVGRSRTTARSSCRSRTTSPEGAKLPVFWGDPLFQGLHVGFFVAIGALVVYWLILNRTTLGYGVKAVGFNPEAARYGGISVSRNYFLAMAISGAFAGLAGAIDILGWQFRLSVDRHHRRDHRVRRHRRRAARPQHRDRRRARGAALRRAPHRHVDPEPRPRGLPARARLEPDAADPGPRRALRRCRRDRALADVPRAQEARRRDVGRTFRSLRGLREGLRAVAWIGIALGLLGAGSRCRRSRPARGSGASSSASSRSCSASASLIRGERRFGGFAIASGVLGFTVGYLATLSGVGKLETVVVWSALFASMLRFATPLIFAAIGGMFSERSGVVEHRARGDDADRCLLRHPRRRQDRLVVAGTDHRRSSREG